jgi:SAM-dependent methyltransferase
MGKLYDLIKFRNELNDSIDDLNLGSAIYNKIGYVKQLKQNNPSYIDQLNNFILQYDQLAIESQALLNSIVSSVEQLSIDINSMSSELFDNEEYREEFSEKNVTQILELVSDIPRIETHIVSKITGYSNWHYPALHISPRSKNWINYMVAADPLYLTDSNINKLKEIVSTYPEIYQKRLRLYEIENRDFSMLPKNQFGFVLCWDNFNYLSIEKIEKYVREVFDLLRPGGTFIFSYNNCDLLGPAIRAEVHAGSYCNSKFLKQLFNEIGYELIEFQDLETGDAFNTHVSWAEIRKPGKLTTIKAFQAMAQIIEK